MGDWANPASAASSAAPPADEAAAEAGTAAEAGVVRGAVVEEQVEADAGALSAVLLSLGQFLRPWDSGAVQGLKAFLKERGLWDWRERRDLVSRLEAALNVQVPVFVGEEMEAEKLVMRLEAALPKFSYASCSSSFAPASLPALPTSPASAKVGTKGGAMAGARSGAGRRRKRDVHSRGETCTAEAKQRRGQSGGQRRGQSRKRPW
jgi:hypothetical protein